MFHGDVYYIHVTLLHIAHAHRVSILDGLEFNRLETSLNSRHMCAMGVMLRWDWV